MSTATSSVGAVFLMMAASMTGFVKWTYSTSPGIGHEGLSEPPIPEIVPEGTVQDHEKVEAWEWRLVADALSNHFLNPHLLADIPMAAWAVIALLACIDMVVLAWMLRQFCCRRRGNDVKVTELADAVAANVCGNGPLPLLLSPSHQKKPLTDDGNKEAEEDTEKVVEDSVATNVSESCPSPVLLSPSRPTADSRVCVTSQTTDLTGEGRGFPSCAPPCDTLTGDVPCDTLMEDVPCATVAQSAFVSSLTMDLTWEGRGVPSCAPPTDTLTSDVPCDTLMGDVPCATFAQSAFASSLTVDLIGEGRGFSSCAPPCDTLTSDVPCDTLMSDVPGATFAQSAFVSSLTVDLTGQGRGVPLRDIPCDTVHGDYPRDTLMSDCEVVTGAFGSSCCQDLTKSLDLINSGRMALKKPGDHEERQDPTPAGSVSSASSIEIELFGGSSDATITMDLTSGRSGWGLVAGSRR